MKVVRSNRWTPVGKITLGNFGNKFLFKDEKYGDVLALKVAKYVDVSADLVYIFDADEGISLTRSSLAKLVGNERQSDLIPASWSVWIA